MYTYGLKKQDMTKRCGLGLHREIGKNGQGKLNNVPTLLEHLKLGDHVRFKTDKGGITWGR